MQWQENIRGLIQKEFQVRKARNRRFSLRSFSKELNVSPALVSRFKAGRMDISKPTAKKLIMGLKLTAEKQDHFLVLIGAKLKRSSTPISIDSRFLLDNWLYITVWVYLDIAPEKATANFIAKRLGLRESIVKDSIDLLLRKKLLVKEKGRLKKPVVHLTLGDGPSDEQIKKFHSNNLFLLKRGLDEVPASKRHFSNITFSGSPAQLSRAKEEIEKSLKKVSAIFDGSEEKCEVYQYSAALIPLHFEEGEKIK